MKIWDIYKTGCYCVLKKNKITKFTKECIILKSPSLRKKNKSHVFPHNQILAYSVYMHICKWVQVWVHYAMWWGEQERLLLGYKAGWNTGKGCGTHKRTYKASCFFEFKFCHGSFIFVADKCLIKKLKIDGVGSKSKVKPIDFIMSVLNV